MRNYHRVVEEILQPLDPDRRAFRLVGGVLVERTVKEVLPTVSTNRENVSTKWTRQRDYRYNTVSLTLVLLPYAVGANTFAIK